MSPAQVEVQGPVARFRSQGDHVRYSRFPGAGDEGVVLGEVVKVGDQVAMGVDQVHGYGRGSVMSAG